MGISVYLVLQKLAANKTTKRAHWIFWIQLFLHSIWTLNQTEPVVCAMDAKECLDGSYVGRVAPNCDFAACPKESLIRIENLRANEQISSPLIVKGSARGFWFFEADFPIKLFDENGSLLTVAIAQAQGEWMTEDFVPFSAELNFESPKTKKGTLVLEKDNPSGLIENADELKIPIIFSAR